VEEEEDQRSISVENLLKFVIKFKLKEQAGLLGKDGRLSIYSYGGHPKPH
jgi:hypothetical protein